MTSKGGGSSRGGPPGITGAMGGQAGADDKMDAGLTFVIAAVASLAGGLAVVSEWPGDRDAVRFGHGGGDRHGMVGHVLWAMSSGPYPLGHVLGAMFSGPCSLGRDCGDGRIGNALRDARPPMSVPARASLRREAVPCGTARPSKLWFISRVIRERLGRISRNATPAQGPKPWTAHFTTKPATRNFPLPTSTLSSGAPRPRPRRHRRAAARIQIIMW